jgi:L-ascorbate metabolism protein UlaG (beta-lactamase superfamily)
MTLSDFMKTDGDGFFYIGHSSALVRIGKDLLLFDPAWGVEPYAPFWKTIPAQINCDSILDQVSAVIVSHEHADHLCKQILQRVKSKIVTISGTSVFREVTTVTKAVPGQIQALRPSNWLWSESLLGFDFYFVPHPTNKIDSSVFVRSKQTGYTFYHGNDCFLTSEVLRRIKEDVPRVDVALIPYAYISWWPFLQEGISEEFKLKEIERMNRKHVDMANEFVEVMKPKYVIPSGASIYYNDGRDHILNRHMVSPMCVKEGVSMQPGDYIVDDIIHRNKEVNLDGLYCRQPPIDPIVNLMKYDWSWLPEVPESLKGNHISINGMSLSNENWPSHLTRFDFDREQFHRWATLKASMEDLIGTRRFTFRRDPDIYKPEVLEWVRSL